MLYLVTSGAPSPQEPVADLVRQLHQRGWEVAVLSTPMGQRFHDLEAIERTTGASTWVEWRRPGTGTALPPPQVILACPLTFTTLNKVAAGIGDTMAAAVMCEMLGAGVPTVVAPQINAKLSGHIACETSISAVRSMGARVVHDMEEAAGYRLPAWSTVVSTVEEVADNPTTET
ncbi:flavoprotein [Haloactinospora alba]|uniref:Flavoprotein n=1 Tax=Haloactinospora alba TaxID=405555 RepID=A0A543NNU5_9ACTN|nr:flavoprotein [Haloactinospora alba]TQN33504.1 flavoprotein [Haloactinospora alba]